MPPRTRRAASNAGGGGVLASLSSNVPAVKGGRATSRKDDHKKVEQIKVDEEWAASPPSTPPPMKSVVVGGAKAVCSPLTQPRVSKKEEKDCDKEMDLTDYEDYSTVENDSDSDSTSTKSSIMVNKQQTAQRRRRVIEESSSDEETAEMDEEHQDVDETVLEVDATEHEVDSEADDAEEESEDEYYSEADDLEDENSDEFEPEEDDEYVPDDEDECASSDEELSSYVEEEEDERKAKKSSKQINVVDKRDKSSKQSDKETGDTRNSVAINAIPDAKYLEAKTSAEEAGELSSCKEDALNSPSTVHERDSGMPDISGLQLNNGDEAEEDDDVALLVDDDSDCDVLVATLVQDGEEIDEDDILVATIVHDDDDENADDDESNSNDFHNEEEDSWSYRNDDNTHDDDDNSDGEDSDGEDSDDTVFPVDEEDEPVNQTEGRMQLIGDRVLETEENRNLKIDQDDNDNLERDAASVSTAVSQNPPAIIELEKNTIVSEIGLDESKAKREVAEAVPHSNAKTPSQTRRTARKSFFRLEGVIKRGKWKLGSKIGVGSFGTVHVGMNNESGKLMAVKKFKVDGAIMKDIRREVELMRSLDHQNIVRYLGAQMDKTHLHIFQEWVPGGSVATLLGRFGPFTLQVIQSYLSQTLSGLAYLHENDIIHRDIKGSNILVNDEGIVKLADFGASKKLDNLRANLLMSMTVRGTPYFMSPEVFEEKYSAKADIWGIGCVAYQMISGTPPWKEGGFSNPISLFNHIKKHEGPPIFGKEHDSRLSKEDKNIYHLLQDLLAVCFDKDPSKRPDAVDLLEHNFFTEMHHEVDDQSVYSRGLFSPRIDEHGETPKKTSAEGKGDRRVAESPFSSPMRPPAPTPNSLVRSKSVVKWRTTFTSPPRNISSSQKKTTVSPMRSSPFQSPQPDSGAWPEWAQAELQKRNLFDKTPKKKDDYPTEDEAKITTMMDSLALSPDTTCVVAGGGTGMSTVGTSADQSRLVGLNLLENSNATYEI